MDEPTTAKEKFIESLNRCTSSDEFVRAFYKRFLSTSEEVQRKFHNTDFEHQNRMLIQSLRLVAAATNGDPEGLRELRDRAETHNRDHLDIKPELYKLWRTAVIQTARQFDDQWDDTIERAWHETLRYAIDYMIRRY